MEVASPQRTTGVKNPEEIRLAYGAITFWILRGVYPRGRCGDRRAQNDSLIFKYCIFEDHSAETSGDVVLRFLLFWVLENLFGAIQFDEFAGEEKSHVVRDAGSLQHVVRDNDDGAEFFQFEQQIFNLRR